MWTWLLSEDLQFQFRKRLPALRRQPYREKGISKSSRGRSCGLPLEFASHLSEQTRLKNEFYLWALNHLPPFEFDGPNASIRVLDLGSRDFSYAPALSLYLSQLSQNFEVLGLELDPYRMFLNLYRRGDLASYYIQLTNQSFAGKNSSRFQYLQGDWLRDELGVFDLITCFFPFLYEDLHLRFGLPKRAFDPKKCFEKIFRTTNRAIFFHQGKEELKDALQLIQETGVGSVAFSRLLVAPAHFLRKHDLGVVLWEK